MTYLARLLLLVCIATVPLLGYAQTTYSVLVDSDNNEATGCDLVTPAVSGIEQRLTASVDLASSMVTALTLETCAGGTFGAPSALPGAPYPLGLNNGINGADVVELAVDANLIASSGSTLRLYFISEDPLDALLSTDDTQLDAPPIMLGLPGASAIPTMNSVGLGLLVLLLMAVLYRQLQRPGGRQALSVLLVVISGLVLAATPDGSLDEWTGQSPVGIDPVGDGGPNTDIVAAFAAVMNGVLGFRIDVTELEDAAPDVVSAEAEKSDVFGDLATPPNDQDIDIDSDLQLTFNENVTVAGNWAQVDCSLSGLQNIDGSGGAVGTLAVTDTDPIYTLNPGTDFTAGDTCTLTVFAAQVSDDDSLDPPDTMAADFVISFSTLDVAPEVTTTTPTDAATVAVNATVTVDLSESVSINTGAIVFNCDASPVSFTDSGASDVTSITLTPAAALPEGANCSVTLPAASVTDTDTIDPPDELAADFTLTFSTDAAPGFVSSTPADGAMGVALDSTIQITFDEAVEAAAAGFGLDCGSGPVGFSVGGSGTAVVTLTPDANLPQGAICIVTLNSGINDSDAFDPPDDYSGNVASFSFATVDAAPQVTGIQVEVAGVLTAAPATNVDADTSIVVTFSEAVSASAGAFTVDNCTVSGDVSGQFSVSGLSGMTATLTNTGAALVPGETCTLTVVAANITDDDAVDPPDTMAADVSTTFTIDAVLQITAVTVDTEAAVDQDAAAAALIDVNPGTGIDTAFSEAADGTGNWLSIVCDGVAVALTPAALSNQTTATETPGLEAGESCTLTFASANLTDTDASDPPDNLDGDNNGLPGGDKIVTFGVRPNAVADSYTNVHTNIGLSVPLANGVLANDDLGDASPATVVGWGTSAVNAQANSVAAGVQGATAQGGLATVNADGSFDYDPPPGFTGTDNFFYHISNANGDHVGQVDLAVTGTRIWFINDTSPGSANLGTLQNPFTTLGSFNASANTQAGDFVHIEHNSAAYAGGITLENNMTVIGEGASNTLPDYIASLSTRSAFSPSLPALGGSRPVLTNGGGNGVTLAGTNTLRGFDVGNTSGAGIFGSGPGTLMVAECSITGTGVGINVSGKTLAANFNDISSSNNSGILLNNVGGDFDVSNTLGSIINAGSNIAVNIVGNPTVDLGVTLRSVSANSTSNGMVLTNTTGSFTVIGDGTTGGTLDGLNNGSGGTISSTTGNAISLTNTGPVVIQQMLIGQAGALGNIDGNGILADGIAALTVRNTDFINVADQNSPDEAAILVITPDAGMGVTLANNLFNRSWDDHVRIENARDGTTAGVVMGTIAITANNFDDNDASGNGNDAVLYVGENNSFATLLVQSNRFHNSDGDHIQIALNGSADVESTIGGAGALANNTTSNGMGNVLGSGFTMSSGQGIGLLNFNADPIFRINNNSVQDAVAAAINVNMTATSTGAAVYHSTVNANNVGTDGDANSGGFGITLNQNGAGHLRAVMDDNQVHEYAGDYGQRLAADEGIGRLDVTADNNLVTDATNGVNFDGIGIFAGATSTDASTTCADLTNNDWVVEAIPTDDDDYSMGGLFSGSQIILPGSGFTNEMGAAAIETFLAGQNTSTPDGLFFFLNGHLGVNDGSCNIPLP